jgi:acetylornithine/N-succinyldiaminopimelate aminotransferase
MSEEIQREKQSIFQTYNRLNVVIDKADGIRIYDTNGNEYLDFLGGIAVNVLGHNHKKINEAIIEQLSKYLHVSNFFYQEPQIRLAEEIKKLTKMDRVFFANSGSETSEGALKLVRKWGSSRAKQQIISFKGQFHGRTYGALSLMDKPQYKEGMGPFLDGIDIIEYNSITALEENISENTAAVFLEFLMGEGGLVEVKPEVVAKLKELKEKYNFLIVADEIQSAMGRTGKFCAYQHFDIDVDVITIAKGIGGGLPLGAIIAKEEVANSFDKGHHGTTFGGNALSCVAGLVVIDELNSGLQEHIIKIGKYLENRLNDLKSNYPNLIRSFRGRGLMCGIVLEIEARPIIEKLLDRRVIANATSINVLRLVPPYIINESDVDEFISHLDAVLKGI